MVSDYCNALNFRNGNHKGGLCGPIKNIKENKENFFSNIETLFLIENQNSYNEGDLKRALRKYKQYRCGRIDYQWRIKGERVDCF